MVALAGGVALALVVAVVVVFWLAGGVPVLGVGAVVGVVAIGVALSSSGAMIRLNQARASQSQK